MNILGISAFYHDSAATLLSDGEIIAAAQEERFTRKKHDPSLPLNAMKYCLDEGGLNIDDIDAFVFYDKPFLKFERLLETYYNFIPRGVSSFVTAMPVWVKEKMFLKSLITRELKKLGHYDPAKQPLLFPEHHLSHAASAFYASPFREALIVTVDGVGEWSTASISIGSGKDIHILKELRFPHSVGLLYSAFTHYLGFRVNSGEYKLMGLAPYGVPGSGEVKAFEEIIRTTLTDIKPDGSVWLNKDYFTYATGLKMMPEKKWERLFGFPPRKPESATDQHHCNLAMAIQNVTEEIILKMVQHGKEIAGDQVDTGNLCLAGGVALNCVANGRLLKQGKAGNIFVQPAAGDAGGSLGAALAAYHIHYGHERTPTTPDLMKGSFLGPEYLSPEIRKELKKFRPVWHEVTPFSDLAGKVAGMISQGKIVGWFQGRMEFGPRALGNRSILGDARNPDMQKKLNLKIKYRESFRPFAPAVLAEDASRYFSLDIPSPYMLLVAPVRETFRNELPRDYYALGLSDRLYVQRSEIPAVTHLDFSARVQTVHRETNERFWMLIDAFKKRTGCPLSSIPVSMSAENPSSAPLPMPTFASCVQKWMPWSSAIFSFSRKNSRNGRKKTGGKRSAWINP